MNMNKSAALGNTLSNLLPTVASGSPRSAGAGEELGASFATLFKNSREQLPKPMPAPPAPPAPSANAPAPHAAAAPPAAPVAAPRKSQANSSGPAKDGEASTRAGSTSEAEGEAGNQPAGDRVIRPLAGHKAPNVKPSAKEIDSASTLAQAAASAAECPTDATSRVDGSLTEADEGQADAAADAALSAVVDPNAVPLATAAATAAATLAQASPAATPLADAGQAAHELQKDTAAIELDGKAGRGTERSERAAARAGAETMAGAQAGTADAGVSTALPAGTSPGRAELGGASGKAGEASGRAGPLAATGLEGAAPLSFQQALAQAQGSNGISPDAPTAAADARQLSLHQDLHSPGFAPEMGARLSMLASEGVQTAQLHLNPAEMGPVAVQIVLDGQQAQISFHSDQAETRAVLERSLPDLAAALRENGLTLSGGGVFQQDAGTRQQQYAESAAAQQRSGGRSAPGEPAMNDVPLPAQPVRAGRARGVLDTYA